MSWVLVQKADLYQNLKHLENLLIEGKKTETTAEADWLFRCNLSSKKQISGRGAERQSSSSITVTYLVVMSTTVTYLVVMSTAVTYLVVVSTTMTYLVVMSTTVAVITHRWISTFVAPVSMLSPSM